MLLLGIALALSLALATVGWRNSPREIHDSRQVQTALSVKYLAREGLSLAYPLPLFGPPWSAPFEFPLYQGTAAAISRATGLGHEPAGRVAALLFLYLTVPAAWMAQEFLGVPRHRRWIFPALLVLSPAHLYYSRSFMIESSAVCAAGWFLLAFGRSLTRAGWVWPAATLALGPLAALAKLTTGVVFLVPAALLTARCVLRPEVAPAAARGRAPTLLLAAMLAAATVVAGLLWTGYSDAVKADNPLAAAFRSGELRSFVFGPLAQRFQADFWLAILRHTQAAVLPAANLALVAVFGLLLARGSRVRVLLLLACFLSGPLVFANLHAVHDYYFFASGVFAVGALALACGEVLDLEGHPAAARTAVVAVAFGAQFLGYYSGYFPAQRMPASKPPALASLLRAVTASDDIVLVLGQDWNPALAYFSDRRAIMVVDRFVPEAALVKSVVDRAGPARVTALVVSSHFRLYPHLFRGLIDQLGLSREPVLIGPETHVYLAHPLVTAARAEASAHPVEGMLLAEEPADPAPMPRSRLRPADLPDARIVAMMSPAPLEILHPFTVSAHDLTGRLVADAHAPTDFVFEIPAGATQVQLEYGILPGAYTSAQPTDGVEFRVELRPEDGSRRTLFSRTLEPVNFPADRGTHRATVAIPADSKGRLVCRTLPGPSGSISSDWAYWARIAVQ